MFKKIFWDNFKTNNILIYKIIAIILVSILISSNSDTLIVYLYLAVTLFIGFSYRIYLKHFKEYAIGGKNLTFTTIALSFFATQIGGGSTYGTVTEIFNKGIIFAIASMGYAVASFFVAYFISPCFNNKKLHGSITVGDIIKKLYGPTPEKITSIICLLFGVGVLSTQIVVLGDYRQL